jgi:hypothetical protein
LKRAKLIRIEKNSGAFIEVIAKVNFTFEGKKYFSTVEVLRSNPAMAQYGYGTSINRFNLVFYDTAARLVGTQYDAREEGISLTRFDEMYDMAFQNENEMNTVLRNHKKNLDNFFKSFSIKN